jgi:hypothetical protein
MVDSLMIFRLATLYRAHEKVVSAWIFFAATLLSQSCGNGWKWKIRLEGLFGLSSEILSTA